MSSDEQVFGSGVVVGFFGEGIMFGESDGVVRISVNEKNIFDFLFYMDLYVGWPISWSCYVACYGKRNKIVGYRNASAGSADIGKLLSFIKNERLGTALVHCSQRGKPAVDFPYNRFCFRFGRDGQIRIVGKAGEVKRNCYGDVCELVCPLATDDDFRKKFFYWRPVYRWLGRRRMKRFADMNAYVKGQIIGTASYRTMNHYKVMREGFDSEGIVKARRKAEEFLDILGWRVNRMRPLYLLRKLVLMCYFMKSNSDRIGFRQWDGFFRPSMYFSGRVMDAVGRRFLGKSVSLLEKEETVCYGFGKPGFGFLIHEVQKKKLDEGMSPMELVPNDTRKWIYL